MPEKIVQYLQRGKEWSLKKTVQKMLQKTSNSDSEVTSVDDLVVWVQDKNRPGYELSQSVSSSLTSTNADGATLSIARCDNSTPSRVYSDHLLSNSDNKQNDDTAPHTPVAMESVLPPYLMKEAHEKLLDPKPGEPSDDYNKYLTKLAQNTLTILDVYGVCVFEEFLPSDLAAQIAINGKKFNYKYRANIKGCVKESGPRKLNICPGGLAVVVDKTMLGSKPMRQLMKKFNYLVHLCTCIYTGIKKKGPIIYRVGPFLEFYPASNERHPLQQHTPAEDGRLLTAVYYLNEGWDRRRHGGQLKVYPPSGTCAPLEIGPFCNRAVLYWSDMRNPQQVLATRKNRYAITQCYYLKETLDKYQTLRPQPRSPVPRSPVPRGPVPRGPTPQPQAPMRSAMSRSPELPPGASIGDPRGLPLSPSYQPTC